jgi:hypothetical protein
MSSAAYAKPSVSHQLLYHNYNWTGQALPRANTFVGNEFVGKYVDDLGDIHGYEATVSQ